MKSTVKLDADAKRNVTEFKKEIDNSTKFIPLWVKVAVAIALGLGTMVGWKRIVRTVGEKIGKTHLTYAQGASAELVAMATIGAADMFGLPVSTTHVLSSGVAGTMAANRSGLQWTTIRNLALGVGAYAADCDRAVGQPLLAVHADILTLAGTASGEAISRDDPKRSMTPDRVASRQTLPARALASAFVFSSPSVTVSTVAAEIAGHFHCRDGYADQREALVRPLPIVRVEAGGAHGGPAGGSSAAKPPALRAQPRDAAASPDFEAASRNRRRRCGRRNPLAGARNASAPRPRASAPDRRGCSRRYR